MSVTVRPYRTGGWEVDIHVILSNGDRRRERKRKLASKSSAHRWGLSRERELLANGLPKPRKEVPTLEEFAPRFVEGHARANRHKPSGIAAKETILRVHLLPLLGKRRLDQIANEDIQRLKHRLRQKAPKTVNNVLTTLSKLLSVAAEWDVVDSLPCTIKLLKTPKSSIAFHDFGDYERLVVGAQAVDANAHLIVLLGGEAGLRCGEMMALERRDVDLERGQLTVRRSEWKGHVTAPKGGRIRHVPLTNRLAAALGSGRHLRGRRVLTESNGRSLTQKRVQARVRWAARKAHLEHEGVHILRHTFCSHLAMRGAPARAIQELAGHQDLSTTQRYMHLSPAAVRGAIDLLNQAAPRFATGDMAETRKETARPA